MSNKLDLIKKINKEIGDEPKIKETKTLRLLKDIVKILKNNSNKEDFELIKKDLNNILDKIDFKDYTSNFVDLEILLEEIRDKEIPVDILEKLLSDLIEIISKQEYPKEIKINNFPKQKEFPRSIEVSNFPEQKTKIEISNFPEQKDYPKKIEVTNFPIPKKRIKVDIDKNIGIKKPTWYKPFNFEPLFTKIEEVVTSIPDSIAKRIILIAKNYQKKENAIAVKLVDKEGKFIDSLIPPINISNPAGSGGGGVSTSGATEALDNLVGVAINESLISDTNNTYDLGSTGIKWRKGWLVDLEVTNAIAGSVTGNAGTVTTITGLAPDTATTQAIQASITTCSNLTTLGTIGTGV